MILPFRLRGGRISVYTYQEYGECTKNPEIEYTAGSDENLVFAWLARQFSVEILKLFHVFAWLVRQYTAQRSFSTLWILSWNSLVDSVPSGGVGSQATLTEPVSYLQEIRNILTIYLYFFKVPTCMVMYTILHVVRCTWAEMKYGEGCCRLRLLSLL
jgi:hypothetical protein